MHTKCQPLKASKFSLNSRFKITSPLCEVPSPRYMVRSPPTSERLITSDAVSLSCEISSAICLAKTQKFRIIIDNCKGQFYWITKAKGVLKFSSPLKKMFLWHFLDRFVREYLSDLAEKNCDEGRCYSTCLFTATYYSCRKKCCGM